MRYKKKKRQIISAALAAMMAMQLCIPSATFAVGADLSLQDVIKQIKGSDFAIVNVMSKDSQLMGTLTESQLLEAAAEKGLDCCVGRIVKPSYFPNHAG